MKVSDLRKIIDLFDDDSEVLMNDGTRYGYDRPLEIHSCGDATNSIYPALILVAQPEIVMVDTRESWCHDHEVFNCRVCQ